MKLKHKNTIFDISFQTNDDTEISTINGQISDFSIRPVHESIYQVITESGNHQAFCTSDKNHLYVNVNGIGYVFDLVDESQSSFELEGATSGNIDIIKAPMPGNVVKVFVEKDQAVNEGDPLIIIEAMKMETTMFASITGIVKEVNAVQAEQVDSDRILIRIEKEEQES